MLRKVLWGVLVLGVLLATTPLGYYYGAPLIVQSDARKSDVIVLLSSGQIDQEWLTPDAAQRTLGALKLYRESYAPAIITSGSQFRQGFHQAEIEAQWLIRAGVPAPAVTLENQSIRTFDSAVRVRNIMRLHRWNSAVVVTSQMDVPRVRLVFRKLGVPASYLAVPEYRKPRSMFYFPSAIAASYHATYEYAGLVLYKLNGWI